MTKLQALEAQLSAGSSSVFPNFDNMMAEDDLGADLAAALPTLDQKESQYHPNDEIMSEYTPAQLCAALEAAGVSKRLRAVQGPDGGRLVLQIDTSGDFVHRFTVTTEKLAGVKQTQNEKTENERNDVDEDGFVIVVLGRHSSGALVNVGADNFLVDLFVRRRYLSFENLSCYQDIMAHLPKEPERSALETVTHTISQIAHVVARDLSERYQHLSGAASSHPALPTNSLTRIQLTATSESFFQHEFKVNDGRTAKTLHTFMKNYLPDRMSSTIVEWLAMQNPLLKFSLERPQLPGQHHPGLGAAKQITQMLIHMCQEKNRDCLVSSPEYFHNAVIYKLGGWKFLNPAFEGYLQALEDDLKSDLEEKGIAAVSWAFARGHVKNEQGVVEVWQLQEQFLPISSRMHAYVTSPEYNRLVAKFAKRYRGKIHIDWENAKDLEPYILVKNTAGPAA